MKTKEEILKEEIEELRIYRIGEISEDIWQRFLKGEVNLTENLFNEFKELLKRTNDIEIKKAELSGFLAGQKSKEEEWKGKIENIEGDFICMSKNKDANIEVKRLRGKLEELKSKVIGD